MSAGEDVGRDGQRDQGPALDPKHPIAHDLESRDRRNHRAGADKAGHAEDWQHRSVGTGVRGGTQGRQAVADVALRVVPTNRINRVIA